MKSKKFIIDKDVLKVIKLELIAIAKKKGHISQADIEYLAEKYSPYILQENDQDSTE